RSGIRKAPAYQRPAGPAARDRRAAHGALGRPHRRGAGRRHRPAGPTLRPQSPGQACRCQKGAGPGRRDCARNSGGGLARPSGRVTRSVSSSRPTPRYAGFRGGTGAAGSTPAMKQYWAAKLRHPESILLFRMGDFYEIFFDDAVEAAPIMGVTLTSRPMREGRQPMCGVPHHSWQGYVGKLLRAGRKVVICDQVEEAAGQKLVKREITRVLTPGTVVDDAYLEPARSNWLVAAWARGAAGGLAAWDVSTGELLLCQLPIGRLQSELDRLSPAELLQPPGVDAYRFDPERGRRRLSDQLGIAFAASVGADEAPLAIGAAGVVLEYLEEDQVRVEPGLFPVRPYSPDATMQLAAAETGNLELAGLLQRVDRTCTPIGARRMRRWLWAPLRDVEAIELRLGAVSELACAPSPGPSPLAREGRGGGERRQMLRAALRDVGDL